MEINAKIYAVADSEELLNRIGKILIGKSFQHYVSVDTMEPCAVLPVTKTWYGFSQRAEPTDGPEGWMRCLTECAEILRKNGAVEVEFRSPDHPDDYLEYAYTTPSGKAGCGQRSSLIGYRRALGNDDISLAISELYAERTARDRMFASRRHERKEAERRAKGDFEINSDGVLVRYRGNDTDVVIPDGVKIIGKSAFADMKGIERMIMECEDYEAPAMETVTIPDSVIEIQYYAFAYCMNLTEVNIPDSVRTIAWRAFEGCESLRKVRLPAGLTEIDENTFFLCYELKSITIPAGVKHIREGAFWDCSISRIALPEGLISIGKKAFHGCTLKKVKIPESVTEIGKDAFPKGTELIRSGERDE